MLNVSTMRFTDDQEAALKAIVRDGIAPTVSDAVRAAVDAHIVKAGCATCAAAAVAVREARAESAALRDENTRLRAENARLTGAPVVPGGAYAGAVTKERALAAYLAAATPADPATVKGASLMSGYAHGYTWRVFTAMTGAGYLHKPGHGKYLPVPGRDMDEGVREAKKAVAAASTARGRPAAGEAGSSPGCFPGRLSGTHRSG